MKPRNPTEKKRIAYKKDHIYHAEYPHAFRKTWPRIKAITKREERHKVRQHLTRLTDANEDAQGDFALKPFWREPVRKRARVRPLGESIRGRLWKRGWKLGWNLLKAPYSSEKHRKPFTALLESVTRMDDASARGFAKRLAPVLLPGLLMDDWGRPVRSSRHLQSWLQAFFRDEPEWEPRLRAWVEEMLLDAQ